MRLRIGRNCEIAMIELDTTIAQVTVYPDRARVLRRGAAELQAGLHTLLIADLPLGLDPESVRAAGRGTARARLLGVSVERTIYRESPAEQVQRLETEIQSLEDQDAAHQNREAVIQRQLAHLDGLASQTETFAKGLAFGRTTVADQATLLDQLRQRSNDLLAEQQETRIARRELAKTLTKLREELKRLQGARPRQRYAAKIELEATQPGRFEADLLYSLGEASWRPLYDLRLWEATSEDEKPELDVTYLGQVQQKTGEDWTGVELVLSTARPAISGSLPEIKPWYLDVYQPPVPHMAKVMRSAVANLSAGAVPEMEAPAPMPAAQLAEAEVAVARVEASGTAVTFHIAGRADIPADGEPHKVTVASFGLEPELDYLDCPQAGGRRLSPRDRDQHHPSGLAARPGQRLCRRRVHWPNRHGAHRPQPGIRTGIGRRRPDQGQARTGCP